MHRNGIKPRELQDALDLILSNSLRLRGVFSHLKSGDELGSQSFWQEQCFKDIKKSVITYCDGRNVVRPLFHLYNSAGLFRANGIGEFDAARIGIAAYGYLDMPPSFGVLQLKPVLSLWADKIASRDVKAGERIGYGGIALTRKEGKEIVMHCPNDIETHPEKWLPYDIYRREDTLAIFHEETK